MTHAETVKARAKVIDRANKVLESVTSMRGSTFFNQNKFYDGGFEKMVKKLCRENSVSFKDVVRIGDFNFKDK